MLPDELLIRAKKDGFADRYLQTANIPEKEISRSVLLWDGREMDAVSRERCGNVVLLFYL
jgi:hypothetical protein